MPDPNFFTTPTGIAVIAAGSSFAAGLLGTSISSWTTRATHSQRLAADERLAARRLEFDKELAERKAAADIALAERKLALDRAFAAWKRKTEFAEEVLAEFYQARDIINEARSPGGFGDEGNTRRKEEWETEEDTRALNSYFRTTERLNSKSEFFAQLHARRYQFLALFGQGAAAPYDDLSRLRSKILTAVYMLLMSHRQRDVGSYPENRATWEETIGWGVGDQDPIEVKLNQIVDAIEKICRPSISDIAQ